MTRPLSVIVAGTVADMTALIDRPIPPLPSRFAADAVPDLPNFVEETDAFGDWAEGRPRIVPRLCVTHTNAAGVEASLASQKRWGNSDPDRTKPHWLVGEGKAVKVLASNLKSIANSTGRDLEESSGERDVSFWSISIETRDSGTQADPGISDFLGDDAELVAIINAYESLIPGQEFPIVVPELWNGTGVVTHTWPFPYPHYTTARGKTCPGPKKIATFREQIVPRAAQIRAAWLAQMTDPDTSPKENRMNPINPPVRSSDTRVWPGVPLPRGEYVFKLADAVPATATAVLATVTVTQPAGHGHCTVWASGDKPNVSCLNYAPGQTIANTTLIPVKDRHFKIWTTTPTHVIVDVVAWQ